MMTHWSSSNFAWIVIPGQTNPVKPTRSNQPGQTNEISPLPGKVRKLEEN
jgi:hypothetical protein